MRITDYLVAASAIVHAARTGTHEITGLGLAHLDDLILRAANDALEIEKLTVDKAALALPFSALVASWPAFSLGAELDLLIPPDEAPQPLQHRDNVVQFPVIRRDPQTHGLMEELRAEARSGQIGPKDGGSAA